MSDSTALAAARASRPAPTREHAEGMLAGIQAQRAREGHGPAPYDLLDLDSEADRRIVASVYALMAREAVEQMQGAHRD